MTVVAYTDASYDHHKDVAACGFTVYIDHKLVKHTIVMVGGLKKVARCETYAISEALQHCFLLPGVKEIIIYTDQINAPRLSYVKHKKEYREVAQIVEIIQEAGVPVYFRHVKAHNGHQLHDKVDNSCNKALKQYLNKLKHDRKAV